ncbi:MAG: CoA pyrophosphatase [Bacteroidota bacterium]
MEKLLHRLRAGFEQPLPGVEAQFSMAQRLRKNIPPPPPTARRAAVLALFIPTQIDGNYKAELILIQRSSRDLRDRHAGQISFPGGSVEEQDASLADTALREAHEEIGIPSNEVEVLGSLSELYIPVSNFLVYPFVGFAVKKPEFVAQPSEVDAIIEVPFDYFFLTDARRTMDKRLPNGMLLNDTPYWHVPGYQVWGATAMIIAELVQVVKNGEAVT